MKILKTVLLIVIALLLIKPAFMLYTIMDEPCTSIKWDKSLNEFVYILSSPDRCSNIAGIVKQSGALFLTDEGLGIKFDRDFVYGDKYEIDPPILFFIRDNRDLFFNPSGLSKHRFEFQGMILRPNEWMKEETLYIDKIKIIGPD